MPGSKFKSMSIEHGELLKHLNENEERERLMAQKKKMAIRDLFRRKAGAEAAVMAAEAEVAAKPAAEEGKWESMTTDERVNKNYQRLLTLENQVNKINSALKVLYIPFQNDEHPQGWPDIYYEDLPVLLPSDNVVRKVELYDELQKYMKTEKKDMRQSDEPPQETYMLGGKKKTYKKRHTKKKRRHTKRRSTKRKHYKKTRKH